YEQTQYNYLPARRSSDLGRQLERQGRPRHGRARRVRRPLRPGRRRRADREGVHVQPLTSSPQGTKRSRKKGAGQGLFPFFLPTRSEEHTSELQSREKLVC